MLEPHPHPLPPHPLPGGSNSAITDSLSNSSTTAESIVRLFTFEESAFVVLLYSLVSIVATVGNLTVVFIIVYFQRMRTPTNFLILNLAVADLLMAALCIPFSYWPILILQRWPFGLVLCKAISFSQAFVIMSSAYTLVAISIDRFIAIQCPLRPLLKLTKKRALVLISFVWFLALVIACPVLVVMDLQYDGENYQCVEDWTIFHGSSSTASPSANDHHDHDHNRSDSNTVAGDSTTAAMEAAYHYSVAAMVLQYFLPLIVLIATYGGIGLRLWYSKVPGEGGKDVMKGRQDSVKKMIPTMFIVTATYAICWCPLNVLNILTGIYPSLTEYRYILYIWGSCHFMAMFNSMANPIIYVSRNVRFRDGFRYVFRALPWVKYPVSGILNLSAPSGMQYSSEIQSAKTSVVTCAMRKTSSLARFRKSTDAYTPVVSVCPANTSLLTPGRGDNHFL